MSLWKCAICGHVSTDVLCVRCVARTHSTSAGWYCYGCGAIKENAKPGAPCPAGCGHVATASWRVDYRGSEPEERAAGLDEAEPQLDEAPSAQRSSWRSPRWADIELGLGTIALGVALAYKIRDSAHARAARR